MTVDDFVATKVLPEYRPVVERIRELIRDTVPEADEIISYGIPSYKLTRIIAVISPTKKGITLAFSRGAEFEDDYRLLEGVGHVSKNVRMSSLDAINDEALRYYLAQAVDFDRRLS